MKIPCICIDDKNRPLEVPVSKWVVKEQEYHITHVYHQYQQKGIKGVELAEFDISDCVPYNCYRLDRFAFTEENLLKLIELMQQCTELNNIDSHSIVDKLFLVKEVDGTL